jgi:hypothetical protein
MCYKVASNTERMRSCPMGQKGITMTKTSIEEVATIIRGSHVVDQMRKDVKAFLFILYGEIECEIEFPFKVDLGRIGTGNNCNRLEVTFQFKTVVVRFQTPGCQAEYYNLRNETLPPHVAVDLYQKLPKLLDCIRELPDHTDYCWGIPMYQKAASLI